MTAAGFPRYFALLATVAVAVATGAAIASANPVLSWPVVANSTAFLAVLVVMAWRRDHVLESPLGPMLIVVATSGFGPAFFGYLKPVAALGIGPEDYQVASSIWLVFVLLALTIYVMSTPPGRSRKRETRLVESWRSLAPTTNQRLVIIWVFSFLAGLILSVLLVRDAGGLGPYIDSFVERREIFEGRVFLKALLTAPAITALAILALYRDSRNRQSKLLLAGILIASGALLLVIGSRQQPIVYLAAVAVVWHYSVAPLKLRHIAIGFVVAYLFGAGFSGLTRGNEADRSALVSPAEAWEEIQTAGPITDFGQLPAIAMIVDGYEGGRLEHGRTYAAAATIVIPSAIAPWKLPSAGAAVSERLTPTQFDKGTALQTSFPGEGFVNFGWAGVALAAVVFGLLMKWVRRLASPSTLGALLLFAIVLPRVALLFREDLANVVGFLAIDLLLVVVLLALASVPQPWFRERAQSAVAEAR